MPICITGMHRSGTSLVARLLNLCGVYLGQTEGMIPAGPDNPQGFWEYRSFPEINDQILAQFGGAWNYPPLVMPAHWPERPELIPIKARALDLLAEFHERPSWGWKDPRTSLTLPFWQALIPDLKVVVCLRSPLEVTQSLKQRETQGVMTDPRDQVHYPAHLWQAYYQRLTLDCPPGQMIVTHYESYFCNPRQELQRLIAFLGLDVAASDLEAAVTSISNQLYRQKSNATTMATTDIPVDVVDTYLTWCQQAGPVYDQTPSAQSWRQLFPVDSTQCRNALLAIRANHPLTPLFEKSTTGLQSQLYWADSTHDFSETHTQHFPVSPQQRTLTVSTVIQAKTPLTRLRLDPFKVREPVCIVILKRLMVTAQQGEAKITIFSWDDEVSRPTRLSAFNMHTVNSKPHVFWATHDSPQFIIDITSPPLRTDTITSLSYVIDFQLEFAWDWRTLEDFTPTELLENAEQLGQTKIALEQAQATIEQLQAIPSLETAKTVLLARIVGRRVKQRANKEYRRLRGLPPLEPISPTAQHPAQPTLTFTVQPGQVAPAPHLSLILHSDHTSSALEQAALRQWLANQTCQSVDIVTWSAETGDLVSLNLNQTLGQATDLAGLPASLNSRYLCFASADLLRQPPTYLETNLLALETEGLAFTLNTAGAVASLHQKVAQGRLPGDSARPFLGQVLRTECVTPNFTLNLTPWLVNQTRPRPVGRIVSHETAHIEADEQLPFEFSLIGGPIFTIDSYVVVAEGDRPPLETRHLVHPPQTVLPGVALPAERPTVIVVMQFLAIGGAERVALDMMRYLQDKIRFVVVAVEAREANLGTTADNFRQITPFVYNLPDFLAAPL
ncbi:MAG: sulfotransferase, partial [Anaerolineae bacterium]|nr:sulfotransferase [Anaerolineae bacterium]